MVSAQYELPEHTPPSQLGCGKVSFITKQKEGVDYFL